MKSFRLLLLSCLSIVFMWLYTAYASILSFDNILTIGSFIPLHFEYNGNDFGWFILSYGKIALDEPITITYSNASISCRKKRDGFYVSFMRWFRVLPLNTEKLISLQSIAGSYYNDLWLDGWLYTDCIKVWAPANQIAQTKYSTVWALSYTRKELSGAINQIVNVPYGGIYIGWTVNTSTNTMGRTFTNSLAAINDTTVQWFLFDTMGWGLSRLSYTYTNTVDPICITPPCNTWWWWWWWSTAWRVATEWGIAIEGKVWISKAIDFQDKFGLEKTIWDNATVYGAENINAALVLRTVSKNTQTLCRGATIYSSLSQYTQLSQSEKNAIKVVCLDNSESGQPISINASMSNTLQAKDIVQILPKTHQHSTFL